MTREEASEILELSIHATPAERAAQHETLRRQLEDKLAKAPTPGLREKYRAGLRQLEEAAAVLAADEGGADLPVLRREQAPGEGKRADRSTATGGTAASQRGTPAPRKKSGGLEFIIVTVIAIAVLAGGGWWVMKTRGENAEKERLAAEARSAAEAKAEEARAAEEANRKAEQERMAAAAKAEQARLDQLGLRLRTRISELNITLDAALKTESRAERELDELKAEERSLQRAAQGGVTPDLRAAQATLQAHDRYVTWLRDHLSANPARLARARLEELASAKAWDECAAAIDDYAKAIGEMQESIATKRTELLTLTGSLQISADPAEIDFTLKDAYGRTRTARTPTTLDDVPLGSATVTFQREGWPALSRTTVVKRDGTAAVSGDLVGGRLDLSSQPFPADYTVEGQGQTVRGRTPASLPELPVGNYRITYARAGWPAQTGSVEVTRGGTAAHEAVFPPGGTLKVDSQPAGASVTFAGKVVGTTPLVLGDLPAGPVQVELARADYRPITLQGRIEFGKETALSTSLRSAVLTAEEAFEALARDAKGTWVSTFNNIIAGNVRLTLRLVPGSRTVTFEQGGFGGSTRHLTMVEYNAEKRIVLVAFSGMDALNGKQGLRLEGDTLLFGDAQLKKSQAYHRE